jgi:hypothetical protein
MLRQTSEDHAIRWGGDAHILTCDFDIASRDSMILLR